MLFAVHISDGYLTAPWIFGGAVLAVLLAVLGSIRLRDEEIPRIALLTAAFFIASLIHINVGTASSAHLLLNGLLGILLGPRAALAIPIALFLQAVLPPTHGGVLALGVNSCVMTIPALAIWALFRGVNRIAWWRHPWIRAGSVALSGVIWSVSLIYSLRLLLANLDANIETLDLESANGILLSPWTWAAEGILASVLVLIGRRLKTAPEFPLGLLLGELSVLLTLGLNFIVLLQGGQTYWSVPPLVLAIVHVPIALVEGIIVGLTLGFLARVKPELLGCHREAAQQ